MQVRTLLRYLIGQRQAILEIASDRRSLLLGFLFVLSAGFAREYDGADLLREPWRLLLPLGVSLAGSLALFALTFGVAKAKKMSAPPVLDSYRVFLGLFWMTAPLAWLYAIPYERFLGAVEATSANLWTLGLVSVWRVALMSRVVSVLMGYRLGTAMLLVVALADTEALLALVISPVPIIEVMGGIQGSESQMLRKFLALWLGTYGACSLPAWFIAAGISVRRSHPAWHGPPPASTQSLPWSWPLATLVAISLAIWFVLLPFTQPEQRLRHKVEHALTQGRISDGLAEMSAHSPNDFPPHWDPPPSLPFRHPQPPLLDVMQVIVDEPPAPWVRSIFIKKFKNYLGSWDAYHQMDGVARVLTRLPEKEQILEELQRHQGLGPSSGQFRKAIKDLDQDVGSGRKEGK
jgi:hypothetical protein